MSVNCKGVKGEPGTFGPWAACRLPHTRLRPHGLGRSSLTLKVSHDLTIVMAHNEVSAGLHWCLNKRELGGVAMTSRFAPDVLPNGA